MMVDNSQGDAQSPRVGAQMIDVSGRAYIVRVARAVAQLQMDENTMARILNQQIIKGDVLYTAQLTGIAAAKKCSDTLPLCHPIFLTSTKLFFSTVSESDDASLPQRRLTILAQCKTTAPTGVEMESLCAVSAAAMCVYDMCKSIDPQMALCWQGVIYKQGSSKGSDPQKVWQHSSLPPFIQVALDDLNPNNTVL